VQVKDWRSTLRPFARPALRLRTQWRKTRLRAQVRHLKAGGQPIKLIIGAGRTRYDGWLYSDQPFLNALKPEHWSRYFQPHMIDRVLMEHVVEHWTTDQFRLFLRIVRPFLKADGFIRIAIPDGNHPDPAYIEWVRPGGNGVQADDHKVLYTCQSMTQLLAQEGYCFRLLEYFDERGQFHQQWWEREDGFIRRSAAHDHRNRVTPLAYTSLIVDVWVKL
jgi:predicted SAM-dependent methyltransferase